MYFISMPEDFLVQLQNASIFQGQHLVLDHVDMQVRPGDFIFLIGATGSGKSSLLKTLYGDLALQKGLGQVCGFDLPSLKDAQIPFLRRELGIVFQDFQLLMDRSVEQNLNFVMQATGWKGRKKMKAKMEEVLSKVNMETKAYKMPHQLSGGEQQRVAIARALLNDPRLILADEPTGNLDPGTSEEIMFLLEQIAENGKAVLMATHDYSSILKYPHPTLKCQDGKLFSTIQNSI